MYHRILVTLDTNPTDRAIIDHIKQLAALLKSEVILMHVATGVPAQFHGNQAGGKEVEEDNAYLESVKEEFTATNLSARIHLAFGDPVTEIVKWIDENNVDLIAMSTHGHKAISDFVLGTTASRVQHRTSLPVLLLRAK